MRLNKLISLLMIILVLLSNLMAVCHEGQSHISELHFITETCESDECSRSSLPQTCSQEQCTHSICSDESIFDDYITSQRSDILLQYTAPILGFEVFSQLKVSSEQKSSHEISSLLLLQHNTVLRI